jgi:hypothetical protein
LIKFNEKYKIKKKNINFFSLNRSQKMNRSFKRFVTMGVILISHLSTQLHSLWGPPQIISDPSIPVEEFFFAPLVANPQGNAIAIWTYEFSPIYGPTQPGISATIATAFYLRGQGWQLPQLVSSQQDNGFGSPLFRDNGDPDIAMNSSNYAVAVWESVLNNIDEPRIVVAAVRDPTTGMWGPNVILNTDLTSNFDDENINVSLNEAGTALAAWRETNENAPDPSQYTVASFLPRGGTWTTPFLFAPYFFSTNDSKPVPFINPSGNAVISWQGRDSDFNDNIQVSTFNVLTNTWSPVTTLDTGVGENSTSQDPQCVMDTNGNALVIWQNQGAVNTSYFNGIVWGPIVTIGTCIPQAGNDGPDIVVDTFGIITATWTDLDNNIVSATRFTNGVWTAPVIISIPGTDNAFSAFQSNKPLAVNLAGDVMQLWANLDPTIQSAFKPFGQPWQPPEIADPSSDFNEFSISVGLANCGFAVAAWRSAGDDAVFMFGAVHENLLFPGTAIPTVAHCCTKFATQEACVDIIEVAPNPCAAAFNIYCNGVFVATLPNTGANPLKIAFPSCKKSLCIFSITAVNSDGFESTPVPVTVVPCVCKTER